MVDLKDKICLVTGANSGIGFRTAKGLARMGARVVLFCRSGERGARAKAEIEEAVPGSRISLITGDLSSRDSIRIGVEAFKREFRTLDILVNNAGAFFMERKENDEGIEMTMAVNHLGTFRLTMGLLDCLKKSEAARIITVSSEAHKFFKKKFETVDYKGKYKSFEAYARSKLANILFTRELSRRLKDTSVRVNALHPGFVKTNIMAPEEKSISASIFKFMTNLMAISSEKGAETSIYLASSPEVRDISGEYFIKKKSRPMAPLAKDEVFARRLWEESEKLGY